MASDDWADGADEDDGAAPYRARGPKTWPLWVALGLWGLPGRGWAWGAFWLALFGALAGAVAGFFYWPAFAGAGFVFAALWYYAAIRWVDQNGDWP